MWVVEAEAVDGVGYYTYLVDAPEDASENSVATCAYARHGLLYRDGTVDQYLGPVWKAFWQQKVEYDAEAYS
jgi:hypothetical protein